MRRWLSRVVARAAQAVLQPVLQHQKDVLSRVKRLEQRFDNVDAEIARSRADARLVAARVGARSAGRAATRGLLVPPRLPDSAVSSPARGPVPADVVTLDACPTCGGTEWSTVSEYNRFLVTRGDLDAYAAWYDYALCHGCGVVFARRRPVGERFRTLLERFEESLGRQRKDAGRAHVLGSGPLSPAMAAELSALAARGVFVSEEQGGGATARALQRDRLAAAAHIELIGSMLELRAPRVLELRPRFGAIGGGLMRLYGATVDALPLFESQQLLATEVYGLRADHRLNFDRFEIPYEGSYDLVVSNHMMTHAVRPGDFLATVHARLAPGGHLYLYNEPDEADFLATGKSMFKTLNPFHLQTFDLKALARALRVSGFEPIFTTHHIGNCVVVAKRIDLRTWEPMPVKERTRRLARYATARDRAILLLPEAVRGHFAGEWEAVVERAFAAGLVEFDKGGALKLVRSDG